MFQILPTPRVSGFPSNIGFFAFLLLVPTVSAFAEIECSSMGPDWYNLGETECLYVKHSPRMRTWNESVNYCQTMNSEMPLYITDWPNAVSIFATVLSEYELIATRFYLGIIDTVSSEDDFDFDEYDYPVISKRELCLVQTVTLHSTRYISNLMDCSSGLTTVVCTKSRPTDKSLLEDKTSKTLNCPSGWKHFGTKCYYFSDEAKNYENAVKACSDRNNSTMVSIHSQDEQDFITIQVGVKQVSSWIGLRIQSGSRHLSWMDASPMDYTNWAVGEPSGTVVMTPGLVENESCVNLLANLNRAGKWNDARCAVEKLGYICQNKAGHFEDGEAEYEEPQCQVEGFSPYRKACYKVEFDKKNFQEAEAHCSEYGRKSHLVSVTDVYEQHFLNYLTSKMSNLTSRFWIGLSDKNKKSKGFLRWSDSWPVYYSNLLPSKLRMGGGNAYGHCVSQSMINEWVYEQCSSALHFVCKITNEVPPTLEFDPNPCPRGLTGEWLDVGSPYCYLISDSNTDSWSDAQRRCNKYSSNSNLVTFHSDHEHEVLRPYVKDSRRRLWIGLRRIQGEYSWVDGSKSDYRNWIPHEPNGKGDECVQMYENAMQWNDVGCSHGGIGYICYIPKAETITTLTSSIETTESSISYAKSTIPTANETSTNMSARSTIPAQSTIISAKSTTAPERTTSRPEKSTTILDRFKTTHGPTVSYTIPTLLPLIPSNPAIIPDSPETSPNKPPSNTETTEHPPLQSRHEDNHRSTSFLGAGSVAAIIICVVLFVTAFIGAASYIVIRKRRSAINPRNVSNDNLTREEDL